MNTKPPVAFSALLMFLTLFGIFGILSSAPSAIAQGVEDAIKGERTIQGRIGFRFLPLKSAHRLDGEIFSSDDDIMPYPFFFLSMQYDPYGVNIGWAEDQNEKTFRFALRYTRFGKNMYIYGGPVLYHFNKKHNYTIQVCDENASDDLILYQYGSSCNAKEVIIKTDRPDGKSLWLGISSGLGIQYRLSSFVLSHELEIYFTPCKYEAFICTGSDVKLLSVHLVF